MKNKYRLLPFEKLESDLMKDKGFVKEYAKLRPQLQIARQMIEARIKKKITQAELAKKANNGQAVISRLEGMNAKPSISLLSRIATALDTEIKITIRPT